MKSWARYCGLHKESSYTPQSVKFNRLNVGLSTGYLSFRRSHNVDVVLLILTLKMPVMKDTRSLATFSICLVVLSDDSLALSLPLH